MPRPRTPGSRRLLRATLGATVLVAACARGTATGRVTPARTPRDVLRTGIDSLVSAPSFRTAHWGVLVVDPESGDTIYSRNAGKLFMPASNQKILTGAVALALLGPDYRYRTTFAARGPVANGTLRGDLVVIGRGDPTISDHMRGDAMAPMRDIADSLVAHGVRTITGRVVKGGDAFPDANLGYGWPWDQLDEPYSAGVDELFFNEGFTRVVVRGGAAPLAPAAARSAPIRTYPVLEARALTVPAGTPQQPQGARVTLRTDSANIARVIVGGGVAVGDSTVVEIAYRDPAGAYLAALGEALAERGIVLESAAVSTGAAGNATPAAGADTIFTYLSPPLRDVLKALEKPSQNQIAEILLKTLALERTGSGRADSGRRVIRDQLLAWGAAPDGFIVRDGSGLSRYDVVTPETIVRTLVAIRRHPSFPVFYDALPIAGVDGTIARRMKGTRAEGNVRAKTGSIDLARSLSGYVTTADGRVLVFSVLSNNWTTPASEVTAVQDSIAARLAALRLPTR